MLFYARWIGSFITENQGDPGGPWVFPSDVLPLHARGDGEIVFHIPASSPRRQSTVATCLEWSWWYRPASALSSCRRLLWRLSPFRGLCFRSRPMCSLIHLAITLLLLDSPWPLRRFYSPSPLLPTRRLSRFPQLICKAAHPAVWLSARGMARPGRFSPQPRLEGLSHSSTSQ